MEFDLHISCFIFKGKNSPIDLREFKDIMHSTPEGYIIFPFHQLNNYLVALLSVIINFLSGSALRISISTKTS